MLVLGVQQSDWVMHLHVSILFKFFSHSGYYRILALFCFIHSAKLCLFIGPFSLLEFQVISGMLGLLSEKAMARHSSTLAWKIPWTEEPGRLQSMGSLRIGHDWATSLSFFTFTHWRRKWQSTPVFLPGESQGRASLVGSHRVGHDWSDLAVATIS